MIIIYNDGSIYEIDPYGSYYLGKLDYNFLNEIYFIILDLYISGNIHLIDKVLNFYGFNNLNELISAIKHIDDIN